MQVYCSHINWIDLCTCTWLAQEHSVPTVHKSTANIKFNTRLILPPNTPDPPIYTAAKQVAFVITKLDLNRKPWPW